MHTTRIATALLVAAVCTSAGAGQTRYVTDAPGRWKPWAFTAYPDDRRRAAARPADIKALEAHLVALGGILRKTPGFSNPIGFSVEASGNLDLQTMRPGQPAQPLPATFNFGPFGIYEFERSGKTVREDGGETAHVYFHVNQLALPLFFTGDETFLPEFQDLETDVTLLAKSRPDFLGMPRYGNTLVLKKNPAPLWSAVSLEETLNLAVSAIALRVTKSQEVAARLQRRVDEVKDPARRDKRIAEYKTIAGLSKDPAYLDKMMEVERQMVAGLETLRGPIAEAGKAVAAIERELASAEVALAALPAGDRAAPACYDAKTTTSLSRFRTNPGGSCVAIIRPNWTLFNPALPRSAPQLLVITNFTQCFVPDRAERHPGGCHANRRLLETLDWQAVLDWLQ